MTPKMISNAASSSSRTPSTITGSDARYDLATLGRAPLRFGLGTRRITSNDLTVAEANAEILNSDLPTPTADVPEPEVSFLRGFNATIPSSERGKTRRRQMRNVNTPHMGLKKLGMSARGLLTEDESHDHDSASEDDVVVVRSKGKAKRGRRTRESLGATVSLGKDELRRQQKEILMDKENIHVRRALLHSEISEGTSKIDALDALRSKLEEDLLKLKEDELELDDERMLHSSFYFHFSNCLFSRGRERANGI